MPAVVGRTRCDDLTDPTRIAHQAPRTLRQHYTCVMPSPARPEAGAFLLPLHPSLASTFFDSLQLHILETASEEEPLESQSPSDSLPPLPNGHPFCLPPINTLKASVGPAAPLPPLRAQGQVPLWASSPAWVQEPRLGESTGSFCAESPVFLVLEALPPCASYFEGHSPSPAWHADIHHPTRPGKSAPGWEPALWWSL